eukprot:774212_1
MGSCMGQDTENIAKDTTHHTDKAEYSVSRAEYCEEKEIVVPPNPSLVTMTTQELEEYNLIKNELKDIRKGLQHKISILSQNDIDVQLDTEPEEETNEIQLKQILKTCHDIIHYGQQREHQINEMEKQKVEAEEKAIHYLQKCDDLKKELTHSTQQVDQLNHKCDELSIKLKYCTDELDVMQNKMIKSEAINLSNQERLKDYETKMDLYKGIIDTLQCSDVHNINIGEIESKIKKTYQGIHGTDPLKNKRLHNAASTLYDLIYKNEIMKNEYEDKLQKISNEMNAIINSKLELE